MAERSRRGWAADPVGAKHTQNQAASAAKAAAATYRRCPEASAVMEEVGVPAACTPSQEAVPVEATGRWFRVVLEAKEAAVPSSVAKVLHTRYPAAWGDVAAVEVKAVVKEAAGATVAVKEAAKEAAVAKEATVAARAGKAVMAGSVAAVVAMAGSALWSSNTCFA